jgi:prevent-host-death family protein
MPTIGIFEAKTRLSEIVRKAEAGERFIITVRGRPVAEVGPTADRKLSFSAEERRAAFERLMHPRIEGVDGDTVLEWIREGRK